MARFRVVHQNMFRRNTADGGTFFCCFISRILVLLEGEVSDVSNEDFLDPSRWKSHHGFLGA